MGHRPSHCQCLGIPIGHIRHPLDIATPASCRIRDRPAGSVADHCSTKDPPSEQSAPALLDGGSTEDAERQSQSRCRQRGWRRAQQRVLGLRPAAAVSSNPAHHEDTSRLMMNTCS